MEKLKSLKKSPPFDEMQPHAVQTSGNDNVVQFQWQHCHILSWIIFQINVCLKNLESDPL